MFVQIVATIIFILAYIGIALEHPLKISKTAIAIDILNTNIQSLWVLLAITVGTGGSLLVIGSAAGIVAMGMVKELTFGKYIQVAFLPALIGFIAAVGVWSIQYFVFNF